MFWEILLHSHLSGIGDLTSLLVYILFHAVDVLPRTNMLFSPQSSDHVDLLFLIGLQAQLRFVHTTI